MLSTPKYTRTRLDRGLGSSDFLSVPGRKKAGLGFAGEGKRYGRLARSDEHSPSFAVSGSESGHFVQVRERAADSGIQVGQSLALQEIEAGSVDGREVDGNGTAGQKENQGSGESCRNSVRGLRQKKGGHMFGMGSKTIVGLDVGSSSIKAVELKKKGGQIEVAHLGLEALASDIVVDSMIVDSGTVSSAISKLFADCLIKTKAVATAVSGHSVIVKKISLPSMSDQELAETIEKEAAQHIPFDLADVSLDYQILSEEAGSPQMDVLLVAVKKDKILNYTNVLSMAGRTPAIVDIDALALQNCYEYNYQPAPGQVV